MKTLLLLCALTAAPAFAHVEGTCITADDGTLVCPEPVTSFAISPAQVVLDAPTASAPAQDSVWMKLLDTLLGLITTVVMALGAKGVSAMHANEKTSKLAYAGGVVGDLLLSGVAHFKAELLPDLQAALADGVLDATEKAKLKAKLMDMLKKDLPADVLATAQKAFGGSFETWLSGQAERALSAVTAAPSVPASP